MEPLPETIVTIPTHAPVGAIGAITSANVSDLPNLLYYTGTRNAVISTILNIHEQSNSLYFEIENNSYGAADITNINFNIIKLW